MKLPVLHSGESAVLLIFAVFGLVVPNGIFLLVLFKRPELLLAALANPVALVFILEAFFLMFLVAWLLARAEAKKSVWMGFIALSLIGSMMFSVPLLLRRLFARDGTK